MDRIIPLDFLTEKLTEVTQSSECSPGAVCEAADAWNSDVTRVSTHIAHGLETRTGTWKLKHLRNHTFPFIKLS